MSTPEINEMKCHVCNNIITNGQEKYSLNDKLPKIQPETKLGHALKILSNLDDVDRSNEYASICFNCFHNTEAALNFMHLCDNAVKYLSSQTNNDNEEDAECDDTIQINNNELCITCNRKLLDAQKISIKRHLPKLNFQLTHWDALNYLADFSAVNEFKLPQHTCYVCFYNTESCIRFISLYNKMLNMKQTLQQSVLGGDNNANSSKVSDKTEVINDINEEDVGDLLRGKSCRFCGRQYSKTSQLKRHLVKFHLKQAEAIDPNINKGKCKYCNKYFNQSYLHVHLRTHTGVTPFECQVCGRQFSCRGSLNHHVVTHSEERKYLCAICGASFKHKKSCNDHMAKHSGKTDVACEICGKVLNSNSTLRGHYQSVHSEERSFLCEHCPKGFKTKKHLQQHLVTHAAVKPIECTLCGKRFTQKHCLRTHLAKSCSGGAE